MSFRKAAIRFLAETFVGNALSKIGEHIGDAIGTVVGKRIDPDHGKLAEDDEGEEDPK